MIPAVFVLALVLAFVARWWAVPIAAAAWGVVVAGSNDLPGYVGALSVALANALAGAAVGLLVARMMRSGHGTADRMALTRR